MNVADSLHVASALEGLGYQAARQADEADVIVLNTCVVRQSAEDKAYGHLLSLRPLKQRRPNLVINLMGCLVGIRNNGQLRERFPFVDVFSPPSDPDPLITFLSKRGDIPQGDDRTLETAETQRRCALMDGNFRLPAHEQGKLVVAFVPVVLGCSHACTFCVIPSRRGAERSRPLSVIFAEVRSLVAQGVKEVTFLGQIIDRYGIDIPAGPDLASLLRMVHEIEGLERIRFLTSHPSYMTSVLLKAAVELPKVMPHIEVPVQAGDDQVLTNMRRCYTADDYRRLVERIRQHLDGGFPGVSIATDVIVGFPGESEAQFMRTYDLLAELKMDVAHLARYSSRNGTVAQRTMADDVSEEEKMRRFRLLEELQEGIAAQINARYLEKTVDVLFEEQVKGRWKGRTSTNKLVFVESARDLTGLLLPVRVTWTGPWSMQAVLLREFGNHL